MMINFLNNLLELCLEAAPWLVLGLVIGGLIKALVPTSFLNKHLSGNGIVSITKAALFGAPLPLCSCGVIPAALGLRRAGASKPATVSFLVSTPETGVDSVTISYALLGPFMAIVRPIAAIISAITAGLLVGRSEESSVSTAHQYSQEEEVSCCSSEKKSVEETACCSSEPEKTTTTSSCCETKVAEPKSDSCCSTTTTTSCSAETTDTEEGFLQKSWAGIVYSFSTLFVDVLFWLIIGLVFAALVKTFVPITFLAEYGSGLPAMLIMLVIGIPMYVCATASTPIGAGLLLAGVSPGTVMVFLMGGPATNISTLGIIGKELGKRALTAYLAGVVSITLLTGFVVDYLVSEWSIDVQAQVAHSQEMVPPVIAWASLLVLVAVSIQIKMPKLLKLNLK